VTEACVYLDYASTTPVDPRVRDKMATWLDGGVQFGNSSSTHAYGERAAQAIDAAAAEVAELIHAQPEEVIWTSGATESDNLAIIGAANYRSVRGHHVITSATEHKAVLESCAQLERSGFQVSYLQPDGCGLISTDDLLAAVRPDTVLVSIMHANNETGVIQDIDALGHECRQRDILFHVDAAQSAGKLKLDMRAQPIDLLSINAHKACGPQGVGALVMNADRIRRVEPLLFGGGQQRGLRPGTLPVHQIAGMGEAYRILMAEMASEVPRVQKLRDQLWSGISDLPGVLRNGSEALSLCSILNVSVTGVEGESLRFALRDLAVASGSACNSSTGEASYVLRSLGRSDQQAEASIRFSLGRFSTSADVAGAISSFRAAVESLQGLSPAQAGG
jgi:cysteine desulfurase